VEFIPLEAEGVTRGIYSAESGSRYALQALQSDRVTYFVKCEKPCTIEFPGKLE